MISLSHIVAFSHTIYQEGLRFIAPPFCYQCKEFITDRVPFCISCLRTIFPVVSTSIDIAPTISMKVLAVGPYRDPLKSLILAKTRSDIVASNYLGQLIWQMSQLNHMEPGIFIPIPLYWSRFAWRGFNQAEEMAHALSVCSGWPMLPMLKRMRHTVYQSSIAPHKRPDNVAGIFTIMRTIKPNIYRDKHLILVDDLMTTGSTLREAARQLCVLKPASITAVVACRVI
jgi:ComF family protein